MKCLYCESKNIARNIFVIPGPHQQFELTLIDFKNPDAWFLKGAIKANLRANVCADCGFVMLSITKSKAQSFFLNQKNNSKKTRKV